LEPLLLQQQDLQAYSRLRFRRSLVSKIRS
jgi:hypothetical protein